MKKLKISIICLILISIIMLLQQPVKATESFQTQLTTNKQEIKKGEEIEIILTFKNFEDINKGINSYKATLDYNENVFEEVNVSNFESLNLWEEFLYNSKNHEFISIKKAGCNTEEDVLKFKLKAKENVNPEDTIIKVKDVVASEGKKDIKINDTQISISVIKEQDNSNPENPGNSDNSNNGQSGEEDKIPSGNLPNTGLTIKSSFILILIEILVIIAIVVLIKMKKIDKKINKNGKMLLMFLTTGIVTIQFVGTIYK